MGEWDYRYRARLSFEPNAVSGRDPVGFLSGLPIFWKGGDVDYGAVTACAVALGDTFGFAKPLGVGSEFDVLIDLGGSQPLAAAARVRPTFAEPAPPRRALPERSASGIRYRYRADMVFRENPVPGLDSFGFVDGIRVFWKGPPERFVVGKPVACAVALAENFGFAVPLADADVDMDQLEDLGRSDPIYDRPPRAEPAPTRPSASPTARPGTPMYRPPPPRPPPTPAAAHQPPPAPVALPSGVAETPPVPVSPAPLRPEPARRWDDRDVERDVVRALEHPSPLRTAFGAVATEAAADLVGREVEPMRQLVLVLRKELGDARSDLAIVAKELRAVRQGGRDALAPVPKPVPRDANAMTDDEIAAQIVHQLHKGHKWGAVYTSVKNFQRGYNAKVEETRVRRVVKALTTAGVLLKHAKAPDETYSLNPHQKADVARILGVAPEGIDVEEGAVERAPAPTPPKGAEGDFVPRDSFDHTMRGVREDVAKLASSLRAAMDQTAPRHELSGLAERLGAVEARLAELQNAITDQAERLERATPAPAPP